MRVLVVDDDELTIEALKTILSSLNYVVESATDGEAGWQLIESFNYDLILLDVMIPRLDGISLCHRLRSQGHQMPVLLLTGRNSGHEKAIGLDAGADDYVGKPFDPEELVARIRALLRRSSLTSGPVLEWGDLCLDPSTCKATYGTQTLSLTPKEYALMELFLRNNRRVFSCGAILDHLWSFEETPGEEAVRTHIKGLRQKLKAVGATADLIETVYGIGYRLKPLESLSASSAKTAKPEAPGDAIQQQTLAAIAGVWEQFKDRIYAQVEVLGQAATALTQCSLTQELQQQAQQEAHTLAGCLGTFGFPEASQVARKIEDSLQVNQTGNPEQGLQMQEWVGCLRQAMTQQPDGLMVVKPTTLVNRDRPLLLVIDSDHRTVNLLLQEADNWGLCVEVVNDPTMARAAIARQRPDGALLDLAISPDSLSLLTELNRQIPPVPVLVFTAQSHLVDRLEVVRRRGQAFLQKPASPEQLLQAVLQMLRQGDNCTAHIMVVDDDPQILATLQLLLEPWGLKVTTLEDPKLFWEALEAAPPDLLILDVVMPHLSGIELCQIVRNDSRWNSLPILFLTAHTDTAIVNQVFAAGADDFVSKPFAGPELVARILGRLERTRFLRRLADTDPLTGVWNRQKSSHLLEQSLKLAEQHQQPLCFVVLDLDHLRQINDRYGHGTGDAVLHQLGKLLQRSFRDEDVVARWGGEEFIIGIFGLNRQDGLQRLLQVLTAFHREEFSAPGAPNDALQECIRFRATFTAGVAQYPEDGTDLRTLYRAADAALCRAIAETRGSDRLSKHIALARSADADLPEAHPTPLRKRSSA
ncbi:transcriptional regulator [Leptolyngbya sp. 'hensonii']|uniref:response regulator n=1 Tax=Leptolyngbya sp. 'hensonii' TaxID=1922337 RepID=UPI00094F7E2D|nr:response regulator [Leptolyngbya sp. 'hensonii']OLP15739.1 transcriptional regulator [Leptolyngbya sp. 'hensonii']